MNSVDLSDSHEWCICETWSRKDKYFGNWFHLLNPHTYIISEKGITSSKLVFFISDPMYTWEPHIKNVRHIRNEWEDKINLSIIYLS